jgi:hypothetical protein
VTPVPGTTRDILELSLDIGGLPMLVADTAGLRMTDDLVESIGVERAKNVLVQSSFPSLIHAQARTALRKPMYPFVYSLFPKFLSTHRMGLLLTSPNQYYHLHHQKLTSLAINWILFLSHCRGCLLKTTGQLV